MTQPGASMDQWPIIVSPIKSKTIASYIQVTNFIFFNLCAASPSEQVVSKKYYTRGYFITIIFEYLTALGDFLKDASDVYAQINCNSRIGKLLKL